MKKQMRRIAMMVLLAVFLVSTALWLRQARDNAGGDAAYADALAIAGQKKPAAAEPTDPTAPAQETQPLPVAVWMPVLPAEDPTAAEMEQINLDALRAQNPDVVGWIRIPDTGIDYPLMQGEDNDFYLNHTWQKEQNSVGSIFLEHQNSADLTDYNTIVYGHNMHNGTMFSALENYNIDLYWQTHPYVYIAFDGGVYRYEIFAFFQAEVDSLIYGMRPQRDDTKEDFLNIAYEETWIDTPVRPAITDRILTLSTCSGTNYDRRYVLQARLPMVQVTK